MQRVSNEHPSARLAVRYVWETHVLPSDCKVFWSSSQVDRINQKESFLHQLAPRFAEQRGTKNSPQQRRKTQKPEATKTINYGDMTLVSTPDTRESKWKPWSFASRPTPQIRFVQSLEDVYSQMFNDHPPDQSDQSDQKHHKVILEGTSALSGIRMALDCFNWRPIKSNENILEASSSCLHHCMIEVFAGAFLACQNWDRSIFM